MCASIPARAAYAAADAPALPEESSTKPCTPASIRAFNMTDVPRSLNEPVGLADSNFTANEASPKSPAILCALIRGVFPSPRVIIRSGRFSGNGDPAAERRHSISDP